MASTSVLIVDDDPRRAESVSKRSRSDRWDVAIAGDVRTAREAIGNMVVAVLLVDGSIWHEGELVEFLTKEHPTLPVIVLTSAEEGAEGLIEQLKLGAMTYVPRDAEPRRLQDTIGNIFDLTARDPHRERVRPYLRAGEIELNIGSDPTAIPVVVGYIQRILEDYGLSSDRDRTRAGIAISEALSNALIHGNLEVDSDLRKNLTDAYYKKIDERRTVEPYASRRVDILMRFSQASASFIIRDQGRGFDRAAVADPTEAENLMLPSGRGILLMKAYCDTVAWNNSGNEVTLIKVLGGG